MNTRILTDTHLDQFQQHLISNEKSPHTIEKYCRDVRAFAAFLDEHEVTKDLAVAFKQQLLNSGYAPASVNSMLASLGSLFSFLGWFDCKVKAIKQQRQIFCSEEKELTKAEYIRLLNAAKQKKNDRLNLIIQTICGTGIRVSELQFITVEAARMGQATVKCKGKVRTVFLVRALQKTLYDYDRSGHLSHLTFSKDDNIIYKARYSTDQKGSPEDVIIESMDNALLHYNYDGYNRLTGFSNGPVIAEMTYEANKSSRVHSCTNTDRNGNILQQYTYTHDKDGNIIGAADAIANTAFTYTYNGVNRIKTATDGTNTLAYTYNIGGNLTKVKQNGTTIHTYTYDNTAWKDQLTEFDGQALTYDLNGNPLTYGNKTFTWQRGTQLAGITDAANSIAYAYDSQNHRVSKTVNGVTTDYLYSGDLLMRQVSGGHTLDFVYDTDRMIGFKYDGVPYFFAKNLYGDVVSVLNQSGTVVASYTYDPFGNVLSATGSMASINPIRYRSYYQDDETGWYYLATRYYNPIWGRFLNADSTFIAGDDLFTGTNMYAYCNDNPLTFVDENGKAASLVDELLSRLTNRIANYVSQQVSKYLGEKIMTPIGNFFMESIAPTVGGLMDELYTFLGVPRWNERNYPFQGIPLLQLRTFFPKNMEPLAGLGAMFLDFHKNWDWNSKNYGNYTTLPGNYQWQKGVGYIWWYDWFFELGGSVGKERFPFVANNQVYVVWCWKGDYWNLGAGAEIGVYYTDDIVQAIKGYFEIDSENLLLDVKMNVYYTEDNVERQITTNFTQRNWWVTSFTPSIHRPKADDIRVALNVSFVSNNVHPNLIQPFYETWVSQPDEWDLEKIDIASPPVYQYLNGYQFNINY